MIKGFRRSSSFLNPPKPSFRLLAKSFVGLNQQKKATEPRQATSQILWEKPMP